jgi:hypothetical protein
LKQTCIFLFLSLSPSLSTLLVSFSSSSPVDLAHWTGTLESELVHPTQYKREIRQFQYYGSARSPKPTQSCTVTLKLETEMDEGTREIGAKVARIVYSSRPEKKVPIRTGRHETIVHCMSNQPKVVWLLTLFFSTFVFLLNSSSFCLYKLTRENGRRPKAEFWVSSFCFLFRSSSHFFFRSCEKVWQLYDCEELGEAVGISYYIVGRHDMASLSGRVPLFSFLIHWAKRLTARQGERGRPTTTAHNELNSASREYRRRKRKATPTLKNCASSPSCVV